MIRSSTSTLCFLALLGAFMPGLGCLVSFDGYGPLGGTSSSGGSGARGGENGAGKATGGNAAAGKGGNGKGGAGGAAGNAGSANLTGGRGGTGNVGNEAGESGEAGTVGGGGDESGGSSGAATGGNAGVAGSSAGQGGAGGTSGASGGNAGSGGSAAGSAGTSAGSGGSAGSSGAEGCPLGLPGPAMIEVPKPDDGVFCIDRTEVTSRQYADFLAAQPVTGEQDAMCTWNASFEPELGNDCDPVPYDPDTRPNAPVSCVDWCDARKFCAWAGKELCGVIGGGTNATSDFADATRSAWYRSCSGGGETLLPYGNDYDGSACVGLDYGVVRAVNVASVANCQGGYDGLWDMSGNVSEWEDSCDGAGGATGRCAHRGGSWLTPGEAALYCNSSLPSDSSPNPLLLRRDTHDEHVGFRCCYFP